jgi:hypothetical protein
MSQLKSQSNKTPPAQMNAAITGSQSPVSPTTPQRFGRIGIPAVAAAAEMLRTKKPSEKPIHASFYLGSD